MTAAKRLLLLSLFSIDVKCTVAIGGNQPQQLGHRGTDRLRLSDFTTHQLLQSK